jgi:hypothetical protein
MQAFIRAGYPDVKGISLSQGEVDRCKEQGLDAMVHNISAPLPTQRFDLITVSHVLEHVPDVRKFLLDLWHHQPDEIYIEVPNAARYWEHFTSVCQGFNSEHINHFSLAHLIEVMKRTGFRVTQSGEYVTHAENWGSLYPCAWVIAEPRAVGFNLKEPIERYREALVGQIGDMQRRLERELAGVHALAVWGAGQTTQMLMGSGVIGKNVLFATDANPAFHGKTLGSATIVPPSDFYPPSNIPILIASQTRYTEIRDEIERMELTNRIICLGDF